MKMFIFDVVKTFIYSFIGWIVIVPLSVVIPKKKKRVIIIGRNKGEYLDNTKYLHIDLSEREHDAEVYLLTEQRDVFERLSQYYSNVLFYPKFSVMLKLFTANIVIVDAMDWQYKLKYFFLFRAKKVQLWHGVFKKITNIKNTFSDDFPNWYQRLRAKLVGRMPTYQLFISTSDFFTKNYFEPSFKSERFHTTGCPRNDIFWQDNPLSEKNLLEVDRDCLKVVEQFKSQNSKVLIYVPTFRGNSGKGDNSLALNLSELNRFAEENNLLFVFKLHPILDNVTIDPSFDRIVSHRSNKDVYPLLFYCDAMITDYSSIFIDYMILDRPVFFFFHDKEEYERKDNGLTTFYEDFMIGQMSFTQKELEKDIADMLSGVNNEKYAEKRENAMSLAFEYRDSGASERILKYIKKEFVP